MPIPATGWPIGDSRDNAVRMLGHVIARAGNRRIRSVLRGLNGVAPGGTAVTTYSRISAPTDGMAGGLRQVETVTVTDTLTTAIRDNINARVYDALVKPLSTLTDLSGNGSGRKQGW